MGRCEVVWCDGGRLLVVLLFPPTGEGGILPGEGRGRVRQGTAREGEESTGGREGRASKREC